VQIYTIASLNCLTRHHVVWAARSPLAADSLISHSLSGTDSVLPNPG